MFYIDKTTYATIRNTSLTLQSPNCLCQLGWKQTHYKQCFSSINSRLPINGRTPLHIAAKHGNQAIAKILIENGADIDSLASKNLTPLMIAIQFNMPSIAKFLIEQGASLNRRNIKGLSPLEIALKQKKFDIAKVILHCESKLHGF